MSRRFAVLARAAIAGWLFACAPALAQMEAREASAAKVIEAGSLDRFILANARAKVVSDPKVEQALDDLLYYMRPPALWNDKHPAWAPARAVIREMLGRETREWLADYSRDALKIHAREFAGPLRLQDLEIMREFVESPGGRAWFAQRLAEQRVKSGEAVFSIDPATPAALEQLAREARRRFDALPAAEKQRVKTWSEARLCDTCGKTHGQVLEMLIDRQSKWMADVLVSHVGSIPYAVRDVWRAELEGKLAGKLPVDSKKQLLGTLEMRGDTLVFQFTFYWNDAANGGKLALEIPRSHPAYAETLALAPGLGAGQSRVLYRDRDGVVSDKP